MALTRALAERPDWEVMASLAGRTQQPSLPAVQTRVGGFGGAAGLATYLQENSIDVLIDATHPFAAQISWNAAIAANTAQIPRLMLLRPAWEKVSGDRWLEVDSHAAAAAGLPGLAERIFLTIGRQELGAFAHLRDLWFLMRSIDPPPPELPQPPGKLLCDRGPFLLENERSLLVQYRIGAIVSKNSGGEATYAKIIAARELGLPVVMVQRPLMPTGEKVSTVQAVMEWLDRSGLINV